MLFKNTFKSFGFIGILIVLFVVLRAIFIGYVGIYHQEMQTKDLRDIFLCFFNGIQYDNRNIAIFGLAYFLLSFLLKEKILKIFASFIFVLCIFLAFSNMLFFIIYHDTFNSNLLGFIFDDRKAILQTGLNGEYFISIKIIAIALLSLSVIWCYNKLISKLLLIKNSSFFISLTSLVALILCLMFMINAAFSFKGKSLDQQITPSKDLFLKKITTDSFRSLYLVYKGYKIIKNSKLNDFYDADIKTILTQYFNLKTTPSHLDIYELLNQTSHNTSQQKIKHIFYIVSESLSQWHFDPMYDSIDLLSETKKLIQDPHTLYFDTFLENAPSTAKSLQTQITGLLQLDIPLQNLIGKIPTFKTAIAYHTKNLGYQTAFYYGGSANWQKLETFSKTQGFEKFFDERNLLEFTSTKTYPTPYQNIWGISDNVLFDFIIANTTNTPSFNMIMTTSNHPPYDIPLEKYEVPMKKIHHFIKQNNLSIDSKILGHIYWYDKVLSNFIQTMSKKYPDSLFVITGDHYDRNYPKNTNLSINKQIPLILYSPLLKPHKTTQKGAHIDITPTILELVAPKNFQYSSFGKPLASNNPNFKLPNHLALGYFVIANHQMLYNDEEHYLFPTLKDTMPDFTQAKKDYEKLNQARAISWYLLFKDSKVE